MAEFADGCVVPRLNNDGFNALAAKGDPYEIAALIPVGSKLRTYDVKGGTYWFARTPARPGHKSKRVYVGSDANKAVLEAAWAKVQADILRAEATPEGRRLRELQALAGGPTLARTSADEPVQIFDMAALGRAGGRRPKR